MIDDRPLSAHFSLYELTKTANPALQAANRDLTNEQIGKLGEVALILEACREVVGVPLNVHSGYRAPALNGATPGSSKTSQHPLCEAADWVPAGELTVEDAFQKVWAAARASQIRFGQLIVEQAARDYGVVQWVHISLGRPYRDPARCGEVLRMVDGAYELLGRLA